MVVNPVGALWDAAANYYGGFRTWQENLARRRSVEAPRRDMYAVLRAYYLNNGLYEDLARALYDLGVRETAIRGLRNPAARVVEFYAGHIWPGALPKALPIDTKHQAIVEPIQQIWTWSNWPQRKQVFARNLAMLGDQYIKVVQDLGRDQVYFQLLDPATVCDYKVDARGYPTFARIDVAITVTVAGQSRAMTHTEVWDKARQDLRVWVHGETYGTPLDRLPAPTQTIEFAQLGIDFIPIAHGMFRDIGDDRGVGAYALTLDKIDEANRQATRLHQMLFRHNNVLWALSANSADSMGRPLPAPTIPRGALGVGQDGSQAAADPNLIRLGDDVMVRLPGHSKLESLVPDLKYDALLATLNAQMAEIAEELPELAYFKLREMGELSGKAVRLLLSDAIDRAIDARCNAEACLVMADKMALTVGQGMGLWKVGDYDQGDLDHVIKERPIIEVSAQEDAETETAKASAKVVKQGLGVSDRQLLRELDYTEEDIDRFQEERGSNGVGNQLLDAFSKGQ